MSRFRQWPVAALVGGVAVLAGGCGDDVPSVGERELIWSKHVWPEAERRRLGLERLDLRRLDGACGGRADSDAQRRRIVTRVDRVHAVLGPDWGGTWNAGCAATRLKFGVARVADGRRVEQQVRRARTLLRTFAERRAGRCRLVGRRRRLAAPARDARRTGANIVLVRLAKGEGRLFDASWEPL